MARIRSIKPEFWTDEKVVGGHGGHALEFLNSCDDRIVRAAE